MDMIVTCCFMCSILLFARPTLQLDYFVAEVRQNFTEKMSSQLEQQILSYHKEELAYRAYASFFDRADVSLPGFKKYFHDLAHRARENAITITTLINDRGGRVRFPVLQLKDACTDMERAYAEQGITRRSKSHICYFLSVEPDPYTTQKKKDNWWSSQKQKEKKISKTNNNEWRSTPGQHGLEDALALEKSINKELAGLLEDARTHRDPHTRLHIEELVEQQVESIKKVADLLTRLQEYEQNNDYTLGEYLLDQELLS